MKIYITGAVASGKTTLAKALSKQWGIPYFSLDEVVHIPDKSHPWGNRKRQIEERDTIFQSIIRQPNWIIEDTGRPCFEDGLKAADVVALIEIKSKIRNYRIMIRWIKQRLGIETCIYRPRFKMLVCMLRWSKDYDQGNDNLKERLIQYQDKTVVLRNDKDISAFSER